MVYFYINVIIMLLCLGDVYIVGKGNKMSNKASLLFSDVKNFLCDEVNRVFIAVLIVVALMCWGQYRTENLLLKISNQNTESQKELVTEIKKNRDKIHFRYFNLTKSLEEIHKVKIDTKNGRLEK